MDNEYDEPQLDEEQEAQQSGSESSQTHHQEEEEYGESSSGTGVKRVIEDMQASDDMDSPNRAKKAKVENSPSRVIHIRSLPNQCSEDEIIQLGLPFGRITNGIHTRQRCQAFLEFEDKANAVKMVNYYKNKQCSLRRKTCYVQFSNHQELKTSAQDMKESIQRAQSKIHHSSGSGSEESTVLRVIVENQKFPVTLDIIHKLFSKFGDVLKIITYVKDQHFQALVQFSDLVSATRAKMCLDEKNIYNHCNTLKIIFSKSQSLQVKFNNDKCRDYTRSLPSGRGDDDMGRIRGLLGDGQASLLASLKGNLGLGGLNFGQGMGNLSNLGLGSNLDALGNLGLGSNLDAIGNLGFGNNLDALGNMGFGSNLDAMGNMGMESKLEAMFGGRGMGGNSRGNSMGNSMGNLGSFSHGRDSFSHGRDSFSHGRDSNETTIIHVSNLDQEKVTPEALCTLFGVYGNVLRVKILFNKKDHALVQMSQPSQAQHAMKYLDKARLWGRLLSVEPSKHKEIKAIKQGTNDSGLTREFLKPKFHRYKRGDENTCLCSPTEVLHLYNIKDVEEEVLRDMFSEYGDVVGFRSFPNNNKMALIKMATAEQATEALIGLHNFLFEVQGHIRVSFSKSTVREDR